MISIALRWMLSILQLRVAYYIYLTRKENAKLKASVRISWTTSLELLHALFVTFVWIGFGTNVISATNGTGPAFFFITILPMQIAYLLSCIKIVHLGNKIIPKKIRTSVMIKRSNSPNTSDPNMSKSTDDSSDIIAKNLSLIKSDIILSSLFGSMIVTIIYSTLSMVFVGTIHQPGTTDVWTRSGMASQGIYCLAGYFIIVRQTFRVTNYIENVHMNKLKVAVKVESNAENTVHRTVKMMKFRTILFGLSVATTIVLFFVCSSGLFFTWQMLLGIFLGSMICSFANTIMYMPRNFSPFARGGKQKNTSRGSRVQDGNTDDPTKSDSKGNKMVTSPKAGTIRSVTNANDDDYTVTQANLQGSVTDLTTTTSQRDPNTQFAV